jgi:hypothetical protein
MNWRVSKMSEIKTVTYEGNVYDLEGIYLANDIGSGEGNLWTTMRLISINPKSTHPFRVSDREGWKYITVIRSPQTFGTITPAPIELIDGAAYMFDYEGRKVDRIGIYLKHDNHFVFPIGYIHTTNCTNIRLMTVESK